MAARTIAIKITIDNREAINAAKAQTIEMQNLNNQVEKQTQLQNGLTNSFLKGNLAARAISVAYNGIKDALASAITTSIDFQFVMAKIAAISGESSTSVQALEKDIRALALTSSKSAVDLGNAALEMNKIGLDNTQVRLLLDSVLTLSTALDENLVVSGETVVNILNAYGDSVLEGKKRTEELATTVAVSALNMESFRVAFSYVGATAKLAGVSFEDLTAAMDMLSNAGVKSSTIGTQLRRIFVDLSDENSKASKAIGGTIESLGGLIPAMEALHKTTPGGDKGVAFLSEIFGKTAVSVAALMEKNTEALKDFSEQTLNGNGNLQKMNDLMQETMKFKLGELSNAWKDFGIEIGKAVDGPLKEAVDLITTILQGLGDIAKANNNKSPAFAAGLKGVSAAAIAAAQAQNMPQLGMGDLRVMDEQALQAQIIETNKLLKKQEEAVGAVDAKVQNTDEILESIKLKFALFNVGKGSFDFKSAEKDLDGLANSLIKLGDDKSIKEALKVLGELQVIQASDKKHSKLNSASQSMIDRMMAGAPLSTENQSFNEDAISKNEARQLKMRDAIALVVAEKNKYSGEHERPEDKMAIFDAEQQKKLDSVKKYEGDITEFLAAQEKQRSDYAKKLAFEEMTYKLQASATFANGMSQLFGAIAGKNKEMVVISRALAITEATINTAVAVTKALREGGVWGYVQAAGLAAAGAAQVATITAQKLASGTDQYVTRPTMFMAGESGTERVTVTPRSKIGSGGQGASIVVNIQGDVYGGDKFQEAVAMAQSKLRKSMI